MRDALERYRAVAEILIAVPRYLSREKIQRLGLDGVASVVEAVAAEPDEYTSNFVNEVGGLSCSVCEKAKHHVYFGEHQSSAGECLRVCRYCRWRIKSKADEEYRKEKGLPAKPRRESGEPKSLLRPEQIEELDAFLRERESAPPDARESRVRLPQDADSASGYYGPDFAGISSGWYSKSEDENYGSGRKKIAAWWTARHDAVIEWFLRSYGMFALAACRGIELEIKRLQGIDGDIARYFEYFVLDRIHTKGHLWNLYASDFASRYQLRNVCTVCGETEPLMCIHPDNLAATNGKVLPLCDLHWKTYRRSAQAGGFESVPSGEVDVSLDSALKTHRCPVCESEHSWRDKTYTFTPGFYGIPRKYREICSECFSAAVGEQPRSYATKKDLDGILEISRLTNPSI